MNGSNGRPHVSAANDIPIAAVEPSRFPLALPAPATSVVEADTKTRTGSGVIEIELAGGHRLRAEAGADLTLLQGVIAALTGR